MVPKLPQCSKPLPLVEHMQGAKGSTVHWEDSAGSREDNIGSTGRATHDTGNGKAAQRADLGQRREGAPGDNTGKTSQGGQHRERMGGQQKKTNEGNSWSTRGTTLCNNTWEHMRGDSTGRGRTRRATQGAQSEVDTRSTGKAMEGSTVNTCGQPHPGNHNILQASCSTYRNHDIGWSSPSQAMCQAHFNGCCTGIAPFPQQNAYNS